MLFKELCCYGWVHLDLSWPAQLGIRSHQVCHCLMQRVA